MAVQCTQTLSPGCMAEIEASSSNLIEALPTEAPDKMPRRRRSCEPIFAPRHLHAVHSDLLEVSPTANSHHSWGPLDPNTL